MRRLLIKRMIVVVSIFTFLYTCKYDEMTHMSDYEVEWVTNRHEGGNNVFKISGWRC